MGRFTPYILPIMSLVLISIFLLRPEITGFVTAQPEDTKTIQIRIGIKPGGLIPEDSRVVVFLGDENHSMPIREFIEKSGSDYTYTSGDIPEIDYSGYGFAGENTYTLDISEFGFSLNPGEHIMKTEVVHKDMVISSTEQNITVY